MLDPEKKPVFDVEKSLLHRRLEIENAESKKENGLDMATKVSLQLQLTDPTVRARDRVIKKSEKSSLYEAMDFASIWLERALAGK